MKTTLTIRAKITLATVSVPLLALSACSSDSADSSSTPEAATSTVTQPATPSDAPATSDQAPTTTTTTVESTSAGTTTATDGAADVPADNFREAEGIYTVALDQERGCNFHQDMVNCGVVANINNGVPSAGGMLGVELRQNGFITWETGGQPFLGENYLQPGQKTTVNGTVVEHRTDGTMAVTNGDQWFTVKDGQYDSNLNTPAARGETVNTGEVCGDFYWDLGGAEHAQLIAGEDGVNCATAMERITSYYYPQINNSPYGPGVGDITLRGGSKCTDKHMVNGAATQACTAADGSQLAYLKHS